RHPPRRGPPRRLVSTGGPPARPHDHPVAAPDRSVAPSARIERPHRGGEQPDQGRQAHRVRLHQLPQLPDPHPALRRQAQLGSTPHRHAHYPVKSEAPLIYTAAYCGLRIGELAALRRSRVDLLHRRLTVAETLVEVRGELIFNPPKTARGVRTVQIPRSVAAELEAHLSRFGHPDPDSLVFTAPASGPMRVPKWRSRFWLPATKAAGLEGLRIHDLR